MTEQTYTLRMAGAVARNPQVRLEAPVSLELKPAEHVAIAGPNGAGKSLLVDLMTGKSPLLAGSIAYDFRPSRTETVYENVKYLAFRDTYGPADAHYYYQQRWNAHDQDDIPTVREWLGDVPDPGTLARLLDLFQLRPLLDKPIILLSSGELRKYQLAKTLLARPRILVMDNPFIGLDAPARALLADVLERLAAMGGLQLVLVVSRREDIPPFITHVIPVADRRVGEKLARDAWMRTQDALAPEDCPDYAARLRELPAKADGFGGDEVVALRGVTIRYGARTILDHLDWTVRRGEHWALSGENGAGKSTLLSLVCADNPQSYACDLSLFGRRRGSGESIWEIKKHIGYVSPEMHRAYRKNLPAVDIVASGLRDSIGLYHHTRPEEQALCRWWMDTLGIGDLGERPFLTLSSGEQRLCLLARALVKDPELLVLDEPLHGLDTRRRRQVRCLIDAFARREGKTLVMVTHYDDEWPTCMDHRMHLLKHF